jgi:hypothetical protein
LANDILGTLANVRYVRVQRDGTGYVHLAEVQVLDETGVNRALKKPATQSSTISYLPASLAVNGLTNDYTQTQQSQGEYLQLHIMHSLFNTLTYYYFCLKRRLVGGGFGCRHSSVKHKNLQSSRLLC